jgi:hypothetical protein
LRIAAGKSSAAVLKLNGRIGRMVDDLFFLAWR